MMNDKICLLSFLLCCTLSTALDSGKKKCKSAVEILPIEAVTAKGANPDEPLRVTCLTQLSPSSNGLSTLLLLTAGVLTSSPAAGQKDQDNADVPFPGSDQMKTLIAQLQIPPPSHYNSSSGLDSSESLSSHIRLGTAFQNNQVTARTEFAGSGIGLVLFFKKASDSCSSVSSHPFYCTTVHCRPTNDTCIERLEETVLSQPLFVQGCGREGSSSDLGRQPQTSSTPKCFPSTNFPGTHQKFLVKREEKERSTTSTADGHQTLSQQLDAEHLDKDDKFLQKHIQEKKRQDRITKTANTEEDYSKNRLTSFLIMSVSFAGGFVIGAILAGVCWCLRLSDS